MSYYLYNAAPGRMYFLGNEIVAEPGVWTEVSEHSVNYNTFSSMVRMKHVYLVESDTAPTYDPTHPDNKTRVEQEAPGAAANRKAAADDGGMNADELKAFLANKNSTKIDKVSISTLSSKTQAITAENLAEIGLPPATFNPSENSALDGLAVETADETGSGIKLETLGETTPMVKEADRKPKPAKKIPVAAVRTEENLGKWS